MICGNQQFDFYLIGFHHKNFLIELEKDVSA